MSEMSRADGVPYHCSKCGKPDDDHKWYACRGGEWTPTQTPHDEYKQPHIDMIEDAIVALRTIVTSAWVPLGRAADVDPSLNVKLADAIIALGQVRDILK